MGGFPEQSNDSEAPVRLAEDGTALVDDGASDGTALVDKGTLSPSSTGSATGSGSSAESSDEEGDDVAFLVVDEEGVAEKDDAAAALYNPHGVRVAIIVPWVLLVATVATVVLLALWWYFWRQQYFWADQGAGDIGVPPAKNYIWMYWENKVGVPVVADAVGVRTTSGCTSYPDGVRGR